MNIQTIRERAYATPLCSPAYPMGPYRFLQREYFIISYRTDPELLRAVVPEPLETTDPVVHYEFIRMPDSTGFGDYTESGIFWDSTNITGIETTGFCPEPDTVSFSTTALSPRVKRLWSTAAS